MALFKTKLSDRTLDGMSPMLWLHEWQASIFMKYSGPEYEHIKTSVASQLLRLPEKKRKTALDALMKTVTGFKPSYENTPEEKEAEKFAAKAYKAGNMILGR